MARNAWEKFLTFIGFEDAGPAEGENPETENPAAEPVAPRGRKAAVVNLHTQKQGRVVLVDPLSFDEVQGIVDHLKNHKSIIVNLEAIDKDLGKRMVDFLSGATYALGGSMQKVSAGIFLFAPSNVEISGTIREEVDERLAERQAEKNGEKDKNVLFWKNR